MLFQAQHHHPGGGLAVDLRVRMPPHIAQRLLLAQQQPPPAAAAAEPPDHHHHPAAAAASSSPPTAVVAFVVASLATEGLLAAAAEWPRGAACAQLAGAPLTVAAMAAFNVTHSRARPATLALGMLACVLGNGGAVALVSASPAASSVPGRALVSAGIGLGAAQLLMLTAKTNVVRVMMSTACAVVTALLAAAAPCLADPALGGRCWQSACVPLLWLLWEAGCSSRGPPPPASSPV